MSVPSSAIYVCKEVPINNTYEHTLYFKTRDDQRNYFLSKVEHIYAQYTYIREGHSIKVTGDVATASTWNYLYYDNGDGKRYFNFIKRVVYINDATVQLDIELDVIQTFMFDWALRQCFIEREHTWTDEIGDHTLPEGLETGPLVDVTIDYLNLEDLCILILTSKDASGNSAWCKMYDNVFSTLSLYAVNTAHWQQFGQWLDDRTGSDVVEGIVSMWMYPKALVTIDGEWHLSNPLLKNVVRASEYTYECDWVNEGWYQSGLDGYKPRNNKMLTYPYRMLYVTNNEGGSAVYRQELFDNPKYMTFKVYGGLSPECGAKLIPMDYKSITTNFDEALSLGAFPTCAWDSDTYKVWLAQNQNTHQLTMTQSKIQAGVGLAGALAGGFSLNLGSAMAGLATSYHALTTVQSLMAQKADMEIQPPQARGHYSANLNLAHGRQGFDIHFRTITQEYAKRLDRYFDRYGYLVNRVDFPSICNRKKFTYVKTVGSIVLGPFTTEHQLKIQSIFDNGITFWVNPSDVGVYTIDNPPGAPD